MTAPGRSLFFETAPDRDAVTGVEWLETNGIGGWASSTICGANSRRYHGLLVAALHPPLGRMVLLSRLDETLIDGDRRVDLATNVYPGAVAPRGYEHLRSFVLAPFPAVTFAGDGWSLTRTTAAIHGENTVVIRYELAGPQEVTLELSPFVAARDYHSLAHANDAILRTAAATPDGLTLETYPGIPPLHLFLADAAFVASPQWYYSFVYEREQERGLDDREDLFTPGVLRVALRPGEPLDVVATIDHATVPDAGELLDRERARRTAVIARSALSDEVLQELVAAADQFIVQRGGEGRTVIAGYPWFGDWGRDTMISLPGLCVATGRLDDARRILTEFSRVLDQGMLPNRFPDSGEAPEYNTVDATLWFFVALKAYLDASRDDAFARHMVPLLDDVIAWHDRGTRHGIRVDADGLLRAGEEGVQLTWMDARVGDRVITPRQGKPVEIQALWYNALRILASWHRSLANFTRAAVLETRAAGVAAAFGSLFWNDQEHCLYDCVADDGGRDGSLRPNQLFALSLPYPLIKGDRAEQVLELVERTLLTPVGLRTLAPSDPRYAAAYRGSPAERDAVYHQGTVWPWLLGPYLSALVRVRGAAGVARGREIFRDAAASLLNNPCLGSVAEIFDAGEPHLPRGCVAQAWSVGELLRAAVFDLGMKGEP
jgi:predicted glycogen debranching enzyme